jgi:transcriptional regulator with XRE-family HTH domain
MNTIGDRIRKARQARGLSGEELALAVGYKQQSAIGNLENRSGGTGGKKLPDIARVLRVPISWLLEGPDHGDVPFADIHTTAFAPAKLRAHSAQEPFSRGYQADASIIEATELFARLKTEQRLEAIKFMRLLLEDRAPGAHKGEVGESDPVPHHKAA